MTDIDTLKKELKEYEFNPAESSSWLWFMEKTILLDTLVDKGHTLPKGWHWFMGFHYLQEQDKISKFSTKELVKKIPDEHWLKIRDTVRDDGKTTAFLKPRGDYTLMKEWATNIQVSEKITQINFSKSFKNAIDFSNLTFPIDVSFECAKFFSKANFRDTLFLKDARFNDAKFLKDAFFNDAKFFNKADFSNTTFSQDVLFNDAVFFETADFGDAIFQNEDSYRKETAKFRNTIFKKIANFRDATFWGYANFKGAKLEGRAFFQKAQFECHAPRFYDATFNNEMTWSGIKLPKFTEAKVDRYKKVDDEFKLDKCDECTECAKCVERDKCIKHAECVRCKKLIEENRTRRIEENQNSYENTAILLEETKKYHDQHLFFRHEMGCRRELEENHLIRWAFALYEGLTDYGYGIERAFKAWAWHIALGILAIIMTATYAGGIVASEILFCSISTSIANANPFVFVIIKDGSLMDCYIELNKRSPMLFGAIRGIQTFIGVTLLFLLLTTLRVRFRLK